MLPLQGLLLEVRVQVIYIYIIFILYTPLVYLLFTMVLCGCVTGFIQVRENWKSQGKSENIFHPVTRKSGYIDYSPVVRELEKKNSWVETQNSARNRLFFEAEKKKATEIIIIR